MDEREIERILRNAADIRWDTFMAAGATDGSYSNVMIEQDDVESIRRLQSEPPGAVLELLGTASDDMYQSYPRVLFKVLQNISDPSPVRHCLALLWQLLEGNFYQATPLLRGAALSTESPTAALRSDTIASATRQLGISKDQPVLLLASGVAARMLAALPQEEDLETGRTAPVLAATAGADEASTPSHSSRVLAVPPRGVPAFVSSLGTAQSVRAGASTSGGGRGAADADVVLPVTLPELRAAEELMAWIRNTLSGCNQFIREQAKAEGRRRAAAVRAGQQRGRTGPHAKTRHHEDGGKEEPAKGKGGLAGDGSAVDDVGAKGYARGGASTVASSFSKSKGGGLASRFDRDGKSALSPGEIAEMSWKNLQMPADTPQSSVVARLQRGALDALMAALESRWLVGKAVGLRMVDQLVPILRHDDPEIAYRAAFCLWVLSMDAEGSRQVGMHPEGVPVLVSLIRPNTVALKVIRVAAACLRQCSKDEDTGAEAVAIMEDAGLRESLASLATQQKAMEDGELQADARGLLEALESNDTALTAVDRYRRELRSGSLRWSGLHTASFWEENNALFEQKNFEVIRALAAILGARGVQEGGSGSGSGSGGASESKGGEDGSGGSAGALARSLSSSGTSADPETLCVACHDLGEFAVHHPSGKLLCHQLGVKTAVMQMLDSSHPDVSRHALLAVSKMMIARWEFTAAAQKAKEEEEDELTASSMLAGMGEPRVGALG